MRTPLGTPQQQLLRSPLEDPNSWSEEADGAPYSERPYVRRGGRGRERSKWADESIEEWPEDSEVQPPMEPFDPGNFVGEWLDNLGHQVFVTPVKAVSGTRRRRGVVREAYSCTLYRPGAPDKHFTISRDQGKRDWTCGNGTLVRSESGPLNIVWQTSDGRTSSWSRPPPDGPVYFDPPVPAAAMGEGMVEGEEMEQVHYEEHAGDHAWSEQGNVYYLFPEAAGVASPMLEWKELHLPGDDEEKLSGTRPSNTLNPAAQEFVPGATLPEIQAAAASYASVLTGAVASSGSAAIPKAPAAAAAARERSQPPLMRLSEESPDVRVSGDKLEWILPDTWGKLNRFPKDFCITSPMFGVELAASMQLVFYPNGSKAAESGNCTVALTRSPDSAGIKFEFSVNGRASGPKVCLGRRYLGDYPKPFNDSEESKSEKVVICMHIFEVLGMG